MEKLEMQQEMGQNEVCGEFMSSQSPKRANERKMKFFPTSLGKIQRFHKEEAGHSFTPQVEKEKDNFPFRSSWKSQEVLGTSKLQSVEKPNLHQSNPFQEYDGENACFPSG